MAEAISNISPLLYLYRIDALEWLPGLFDEIWVPGAVVEELAEGRRRGYDVPDPDDFAWIGVVDPASVPSEWLSRDLGIGELSTMELVLENRGRVVLLDDALARDVARAAGLEVWGTRRVLLEAKEQGLVQAVKPTIDRPHSTGMWISDDIRRRVLALAGEK